jgi:hypothetical protein
MAYDFLMQESPEVVAKVEDLLKVMEGETNTISELNHPFVECAAYADYIKMRGGSWQSNWHFVDIPYFDQGGNAKDYPDFQFDEKNISVAVPALVAWLNNTPGY